MENKKILFLEDTLECQTILQKVMNGYETLCCTSLEEAHKALHLGPFAAIMLDIELPDGDGLRFLADLPENHKKHTAIFIISSKIGFANKAMAFTYGADDFISKPFDPIELKMRIDAKIRRLADQQNLSNHYKVEDLTVNVAEQRLYQEVEGSNEKKTVNFTSLEFRIFSFLSKNKNRVVSRPEIINHIWGHQVYITDRTVDAHIAHIRKKIHPSRVKIETVFGTGYKMTSLSV